MITPQPSGPPRPDGPGPVLLDAATIAARVDALAAEVAAATTTADDGAPLLLLCTMLGAFVLTADLARALARLGVAVEVGFVTLRSYTGTESAGLVDVVHDIDRGLTGRDVVVVEDVVDTGRTTAVLLERCRSLRPRRLRLLALLDKPGRRIADVRIDHRGFHLEDHFVVGYGMDLDGRWRELPDVHVVDGRGPTVP